MSAGVSAVRSASAPVCGSAEAPRPAAAKAGSLLPAPLDLGGDAMTAMIALMAKGREIGKQEAQARVSSNSRERKEAIAREFHAYQEAARARESGGFWSHVKKACSTLSKVAAVIGSGAAVVATAGTGAPFALAVAGAALSAGAFAQGETKFLQELGCSDATAGWIELGMSLGGAACTAGSSLAAGAPASGAGDAAGKTGDAAGKAGSAASKAGRAAGNAGGAAEKLGEAAANAGQTAGELISASCDGISVAQVIHTTVGAAAVVQGVASVAAGVATIEQANYEADATDHLADALSARLAREKLERMLRELLGELEQDDKSAERAIGSLRQAIDTRGAALMVASMMRA